MNAKKDKPGSKDVGCGVCIRDPWRLGAKNEEEGLSKVKWNGHYKDGWGNMYLKQKGRAARPVPQT